MAARTPSVVAIKGGPIVPRFRDVGVKPFFDLKDDFEPDLCLPIDLLPFNGQVTLLLPTNRNRCSLQNRLVWQSRGGGGGYGGNSQNPGGGGYQGGDHGRGGRGGGRGSGRERHWPCSNPGIPFWF